MRAQSLNPLGQAYPLLGKNHVMRVTRGRRSVGICPGVLWRDPFNLAAPILPTSSGSLGPITDYLDFSRS